MPLPGSTLPLSFGETGEKQRYSVTSLTRALKAEIEETFGEVLVEGEIGNFKHHSSGHLYFVLKDEKAQLQAVMFRGDARRLRFEPAEGAAVLARGNLTVYERRGNYQIVVRELTPLGLGALQEAFEKLKAKLREEGLFDEERKRPLPLLPMRIGIVTSPSGAAIRDMLKVLRRRFENVQVLLYPARVQGEGAASLIAEGIRELNRQGGLDVLIVGRGGGSIEDLWAFNEEVVARAIAASETPVVSAVGHEVDFTIADFVADVRAATPSAAAEIVVQSKEELKRRIDEMKGRLISIEAARIAALRGRLRELESHRALARPEDLVRRCQMRLDELNDKLAMGGCRIVDKRRQAVSRLSDKLLLLHPRRSLRMRRERIHGLRSRLAVLGQNQVSRERERLLRLSGSLRHLSPLAVMERGYAIVTRGKRGPAIKRADETAGGDRLHVRLHEGELQVRVLGGGKNRLPVANETQPSLFEEES